MDGISLHKYIREKSPGKICTTNISIQPMPVLEISSIRAVRDLNFLNILNTDASAILQGIFDLRMNRMR
jgi:hypothetical protein